MPYCLQCNKSFEGNPEICPDCGALLEPEEACVGDCASCASGCTEDHDHEHEHDHDHGECSDQLWPVDDDGGPVKPAYLMTVMGNQIDYEMTVSLLQSFGVPTIREYPNAINNAKILLGFSGAGMDIYIRRTCWSLPKS
jgi:hypothetical protein